jgi:hypothetical protein
MLRRSPFESTVVDYLSTTKGWSRSDYRLEWSALDQSGLKVTVVALSDELARQPGAGKSIELQVDRGSGGVIKARAFQ